MIVILMGAILLNAIFMIGNIIFENNKVAIMNGFAIICLVVALITNL